VHIVGILLYFPVRNFVIHSYFKLARICHILKLIFLYWNSYFSNCSVNICSFVVLHGNPCPHFIYAMLSVLQPLFPLCLGWKMPPLYCLWISVFMLLHCFVLTLGSCDLAALCLSYGPWVCYGCRKFLHVQMDSKCDVCTVTFHVYV
jgi:hypothetical protein